MKTLTETLDSMEAENIRMRAECDRIAEIYAARNERVGLERKLAIATVALKRIKELWRTDSIQEEAEKALKEIEG